MNDHIGSSLEDFLQEESILEECQSTAIKRVIVWQLENAVFADELLKELHTEIYVNNIQINHKLMSKLDSYCGFDDSE